ncbi:hypothetical protein PFISCL1PPCAC_27211, partial [Pristionchus fissidentatus]
WNAVIPITIWLIIFAETVDSQTTMESMFSSLLPTFAPTTEAENMTELVIDLDQILSTVNKTEPQIASVPLQVNLGSAY